MHCLTWFAIATALAACGNKNESTPEPAQNQPAVPKGQATVAITITGETPKQLSGSIGRCEVPKVGDKASGATYSVDAGELELSVIATNDEELTAPKIVVNVRKSRWTYALKGEPTTAKLVPGKSAEIEADLKRVGAIEGEVHVKGTFTCN